MLYLKIKQKAKNLKKSRHPTCANWFISSSNLTSFDAGADADVDADADADPNADADADADADTDVDADCLDNSSVISMTVDWDDCPSPYVLLGLISSKECVSTSSIIIFCFFTQDLRERGKGRDILTNLWS